MTKAPFNQDLDDLRVTAFLNAEGEAVDPNWAANLIALRWIEEALGTPSGYALTAEGERRLRQ